MDSDKMLGLQQQIRENSEDLQKYLTELESWEQDMRKKEEEFKLHKTDTQEELLPVRNVLYKPKKKSRHKKLKVVNGDDKPTTENMKNDDEKGSVSDKSPGCTDDEQKEVSQSDETGGNSDQEEELEIMRKKQSALLHKEKGNNFFKKGNYDSAIASYTSGIMLDPENPLLLANRAMAFLKKEQFQAAENDCNLSLAIDPTYVKAYLRRGAARKNISKLLLAKEDFSKALELEPDNKQAQSELKQLNQLLACSDSSCVKSANKNMLDETPIKKTTEKLEVQDASITEIECIFPNSVAINPPEMSSENVHSSPEFEVELKGMDEKGFVKAVLDQMKSHQKDPIPSCSTAQIETVDLNLKKLLPPVPETSFQFIADWNEISENPEMRYKYLKQFPPEKLPVIFKNYMEPAIFPLLLKTLSSDFLKNGDDVFDYMKYLSCMGRFSTTLMFLSDKEEKDLEKLLENIKSSNRPQSEITAVLSKYRS